MFGSLRRERRLESIHIDMVPMVDCMLVLVIFLVVSSVFVDDVGIQVDKPEAATALPLEQDSLLIAITADGRVFYGGHEIGMYGIRPTVQRNLQSADVSVIIQADERVSHGVFARAYGEARAAGAVKVHFSTKVESE